MNHKLLTLLWPIAAYATPVPTVDISASPIWPNSYIAMGDSYAAGIGAGRFFQPEDYANKACKRFDGSYPVQVADPTLGIFNNGIPNGFNFVACTGAVLEDLNRQREILQGKRAQLITISISGNDFDFAEVVIACAYNSNIWGPRDRQCDEALSRAEAKLDDDAIWDDFAFKVGEIISYHLTEESRGEGSGLVLITGYPKFFDETFNGDWCSSHGFPLHGLPGFPLFWGPNLRKVVRDRIRAGTDRLNTKIRERVTSIDGRVRFVDMETEWFRHRFCNSIYTNDFQAFGEDNPQIWLNTIWEDLQESEWIENKELVGSSEKLWAEAAENMPTGNMTNMVDVIAPMNRNAAFHPKVYGHAATARAIRAAVRAYAHEKGIPTSWSW